MLFLWWPKHGVTQMLDSQHGPDTLMAVVIAIGLSMAYHSVRAGAEEFLLPGQRPLDDWILARSVGLGAVLLRYVAGQLAHGLHMLLISSPLVAVAFTVSGGEWGAVAWCIAAALVQALFYRLSGAIVHLALGAHPGERHFVVRTLVFVVYAVIGWLAPVTSHVAFTARLLGEGAPVPPAFAAVPDHWAFMAIYAGSSVLTAFALYLLLRRRRRMARRSDLGEAIVS